MKSGHPFRRNLRLLGLSATFCALASAAFALTLNVTDDTYTDSRLIPSLHEHDRFAHWRVPMDMISHGWSTSLLQA